MTEDGRRLRRERNIGSVQGSILEMLQNWQTPTLSEVARHSGVTVRSIYRYYEDLDHAVRSAQDRRFREILDWIEEIQPIEVGLSLSERMDEIVRRRIELERMSRPLQQLEPFPAISEGLDAEVAELFSAELVALGVGLRDRAADTVGLLLRPWSIRSLVAAQTDPDHIEQTIKFALSRVLVCELDVVS